MTGAVDNEILTTDNFFQDAFGIGVVHSTTNKIDLPSTYDFSTERYLLYVNGTRVQPDSVAFADHFSDQKSAFDLEPDAGDRVELRIRERPRYVPGYEILAGMAWYMGSTLPAGAEVKVGLRDPNENGFFVVHTPNGVFADIVKDGTMTVSQEVTDGYLKGRDNISLQERLQQPQIDRHLINMYGVGGFKPGKSYLKPVAQNVVDGIDNANVQLNQNLLAEHLRANGAAVADDVGVGNLSEVNSDEFNLHLSFEIDCTNAASGATLKALSSQYAVLGDVLPTTRPKRATFFDLGGSISEGWNDGVIALRTDPTRSNISVDLTQIGITPTVSMEVVAMGFNPDDITFSPSNFVPVESQASYDGLNSILEANAVDAPFSYPTQTYTNPKGQSVEVPDKSRSLNAASETAGNTGQPQGAGGETTDSKETIFEDDIILIIPRGAPGVTGGQLELLDLQTEQEW